MKEQDFNADDFTWTDPVIGVVLLNAQHDSNGNPILPHLYYHVAKDPETGKIIILPSNKGEKP